MAFKNLIALGALIMMSLSTSIGWAQTDIPGPRFQYRDLEGPDSTRPVASPGVFQYDYQICSPLEFPNGDELSPNNGFFFSFDRMATSISGGSEFGGKSNNYISGNRYDVGYMNDDDDGWNFVYEQSEGNQFVFGQNIAVPNPAQLTTKFASVEINKVFRQQLKHGGWIEPYIGLRYFNLSDSTIEDLAFLNIAGVAIGANANRFVQNFTNDAVGFNVGGRIVKRRGRWRFSNDVAISTNYNQQRFHASDITQILGIPPIIPPEIVTTQIDDSDNAFVPAVDYRFELAYSLTRDFGFRGGASFMYLWDGIVRANTATTLENPNSLFGFDPAFGGDAGIDGGGLNESRLITAGFSFGFEYRR